jgi:ABC-type sugar transport system permease subunit
LIVDTLRGTNPDRSRAAILSVALFVITLVFTMVQLTVLERRVHYGGGERG